VEKKTVFSFMKKGIFQTLVASAFVLLPGLAMADTYDFNFTYVDTLTNGTVIDTTGQLGATLVAGNEYQITSITGDRNGVAITGLVGPGLVGDINVDDLLYVPADSPNGYLSDSSSNSGFGFTTADGNSYTPYFSPSDGNTYEYVGGSGAVPGAQIDLSVTATATPEPASFLLIGGGMAAIGLLRRRKRA
jgi:hypothetical protein